MSGYRICAAFLLIVLAMPALAEQVDCDSVAACRALAPSAAGPALLRLLRHENWDTRVEAAFALGSIEYKPAVPELIKALADESDWQLVYASVVSLGRLQDPSALKPLQEAAASYWYPPVRTAAECAAQFVGSGKPCDGQDEILNIDLSGLEAIRVEAGNCSKRSYRKLSETDDMKQYGNEEAMEQFRYTGAECDWFGDVDKATGSRPCLARRNLYPQIAARAAGGWLTGRDHGEHGGELMFFPDAGKNYEVLAANVEDIYVLEEGVLALTGLANASANRGMVYSLRKDGSGKWQAAPLLRLPGAPESSYKTNKREIVVNAHGRMIVIDDQGKPRMAVCGKQ